MTGIFRIFKALPAYALGVCLATACNTATLEPQSPVRYSEIGFDVIDSQLPLTKGIPATSDNIATLYADNVRVVAFRDGSEYIPSQLLLSPSDENALWHTSESYFWPESGSLHFWAWAPAGLEVEFDEGRSSLSFDFSLPVPDPVGKQDAVAQQDVVMTCVSADRIAYEGGVPLNFGHPLASIVFRSGNINDGIIRSISLRNVAGSGKCFYDGNDFEWSVGTELFTYTQTFDAPVSEERTFMMIPQILGEDAALDIVFDDGTETRTYSHSIAGNWWKAGASYTYTISLSSETSDGIVVEEIFTGLTKNHVSVRNSGKHSVYIRAMIEANWVNANGEIVAPCNVRSDGTILDFNVFSTGGRWTLHTDGFFYYKKAVRPGRQTFELFTSYVPGPVPVRGSHLEMTIAAQAVEYDSNQKTAKRAWGNDIPVTGSIE